MAEVEKASFDQTEQRLWHGMYHMQATEKARMKRSLAPSAVDQIQHLANELSVNEIDSKTEVAPINNVINTHFSRRPKKKTIGPFVETNTKQASIKPDHRYFF